MGVSKYFIYVLYIYDGRPGDIIWVSCKYLNCVLEIFDGCLVGI